MKRRISYIVLTCLVTLVFALSLNTTAVAHSGRTDSNGGHRDNKNVSGLGSYHYHCGGYPAHLHDGGTCPYKTQTPPTTTIPPTTITPPMIATPTIITAVPTSSSVYVNGKQISFDAYSIDNSNYFKLRDLAYVLNGTEKQFGVSWNSSKNAIEIVCGIPYTAVGGELQGQGRDSKSPILSTSKLYIDNKEVSLTSYNIGGYTYFKLRDIGSACSFSVSWENDSIKIDT